MPAGGGRFEGVDVRETFLPGFYGRKPEERSHL
jgi:hypothetical protein